MRISGWRRREILSLINGVLTVFLIGAILAQLPSDLLYGLFANWYIAGTLWLLNMSVLVQRFSDENTETTGSGFANS